MTAADDLYQRITNRVIELLEQDLLPWKQPWDSGKPVSLPVRFNGHPYHGINVLILWGTAMDKGYDNPVWMTYEQAQKLGGQVLRGEKGTQIVKVGDFIRKKGETPEEDEHGKYMKVYTVFNVKQIENLPEAYYETPEEVASRAKEPIEVAEAFFAATGAEIAHGGYSAYYDPITDRIQLPPFELFDEPEYYYGTLAHEVAHWSGHPSRLDRHKSNMRFGDKTYAYEEIIAELAAAFVCADLGLEPNERADTAAYIQNWLQVLRSDKTFIFKAAGDAQKAAEYLHRTVKKADELIENAHLAAIGVEPYAVRG